MSDLRHDPIDDLWVTMAGNRRTRPMEFIPLGQKRHQIICPFCKGNETETPVESAAFGTDGQLLTPDDDRSSWVSRIIANKFPSFSTANDEQPKPADHQTASPYQTDGNHGIQELIIPSSRHVSSIGELTDIELEVSFKAILNRLQQLKLDPKIAHGMLFLNCRSEAGASLGHIHWQLIGSPLLSGKLKRRSQRDADHREKHGLALMESLVNWEISEQLRIVRQTENFCVLCPFASRFPFQVQIVPRLPNLDIFELDSSLRNELAWHCRDIVKRLEVLLDYPAYNILLNHGGFGEHPQPTWNLELFPRITKPAGFEMGTDIWVNPVTPETAARSLRVAEEQFK